MADSYQLPENISPAFNGFLDDLKPFVSGRVRSVSLYGGVAKGKLFTETSDVNVLIVIDADELAVLDAIAPAVVRARHSAAVEPLIVAEPELDAAMRAFPVKFFDIAGHHIVLLGEDPFAGRAVARDHLFENARQGLANLSLRLKRLYVERHARADLLLDSLLELVSAAAISFRPILYAKSPPAPSHREEIFQAMAKLTGLQAGPLIELMAYKKGASKPISREDVRRLYAALLEAVEAAARLAA